MKTAHTSTGNGVICNSSGDKHAYLGHFRSSKVLEKGHNQGAPGGSLDINHPAMNPLSNPDGFAAATGKPGARVGGNVGQPIANAGPMKTASPAIAQVGGNVPGAAPAANPSGIVQGLQNLVGNSAAPRRSTGAVGGTSRTPMKPSGPVRMPKQTMNTAREPGYTPPPAEPGITIPSASSPGETIPSASSPMRTAAASAGPRAALQGATDVLRKSRQGVRNSMRGGLKKRKNPRM